MLHLAALFHLDQVAIALIERGAMTLDEWPRDSRGESVLDVMSPSLKNKVIAAIGKRKAQQESDPTI